MMNQTLSCSILIIAANLFFAVPGHSTESADDLIQQGNVYYDKLQPTEALKYYLPAEKLDPHNADLLARIARQYRHLMSDASDKIEKLRLGNIAATLITRQGRRGLASYNGTLGHQMHTIHEFSAPWNEDSILVMHSDGLISRWDLDTYPGIISKDPSIIAAALYRDFDRERDDVTVLVARNSE